jgi:CRP/FNR family transcriptional regulator
MSTMSEVLSAAHKAPFHNPDQDAPPLEQERRGMSELLQMMGAREQDLSPTEATEALSLRHLRAGDILFHQGAEAEAIYFVKEGLFKTFRTAEDGYEQVLPFSGRARILGFDALCTGRHPTAALALEPASVFVVNARRILSPTHRTPTLDRVVHLAISSQLAHCSELSEVTAGARAEVRLARFILHLSGHMNECARSPLTVSLRMTRRDIASHLGVALETVSRAFSALADCGHVLVENRNITILDLNGLKTMSRCSRN